MVTALMVGGLVSCSDDDQSSSTTEEQITVAVGDVTTTATTEENQSTTSATSLAATSTVTVTVTDVEDAVGYDLAGVLSRGDEPLIANVVGGFGAAVEADPFSTTQVVRTPQYGPEDFPEDFDFGIDWPFVTDEAAMLEPGTYYLQLWLGQPPLCCFSAFVPGDSPSLSGCGTVFAVKEDEQVSITVTAIPARSDQGPQVECPTG
jgi:hypothetical protein